MQIVMWEKNRIPVFGTRCDVYVKRDVFSFTLEPWMVVVGNQAGDFKAHDVALPQDQTKRLVILIKYYDSRTPLNTATVSSHIYLSGFSPGFLVQTASSF